MHFQQGHGVGLGVTDPRALIGLPPSPIARSDSSSKVDRPADVRPTSSAACLLLIDDDPAVVPFLTELLKLHGFRIKVAVDGRSGLALARTREYAVILLDHDLPDVMGLDVLRTLDAEGVTTPIIMLTGKGNEEVAFEAGRLGAMRYITKPFKPAILLQAIDEALGGAAHGHPSSAAPTGQAHRSISEPPKRCLYSRWANAMRAAIDARADPRTVELWAGFANASKATLRSWCRTAGLPTQRSLLLARALRAVIRALALGGHPADFLDIADRRTLKKLLRLAGIDGPQWDVRTVLARQQLVRNRVAMAELERALRR